MAVRLSVRFDVFKRDDFTCQYCGRRPPTVVLEVDHITPQASGGTDEFYNLTTACFDCNRGKRDTPLEQSTEPVNHADLAERIEERELQIRAYNDAKALERERIDRAFNEAWNYWFYQWIHSTCAPAEDSCAPAEDS
ncbi:MAG: HNH endonuclease [Acidimicrobiales bacterium]